MQAQAVVAVLGRRRFRRERVVPRELGTVRADVAGFRDALGVEEGEARPAGSLEAGDIYSAVSPSPRSLSELDV